MISNLLLKKSSHHTVISLKREHHMECVQFLTHFSSFTEVKENYNNRIVGWMKVIFSEIFGFLISNNVNGRRYKLYMVVWRLDINLVWICIGMRSIFLEEWMKSIPLWMVWRSWNLMRIRRLVKRFANNVWWIRRKERMKGINLSYLWGFIRVWRWR